MIVINLFGGPGSGKSTTAAGLFYLMKNAGHRVELVTEYAKEIVWSDRLKELHDQLYISAKQNHRLFLLNGKVDYCITDSPLLLALVYKRMMPSSFDPFIIDLFHAYDNMAVILKRTKPYLLFGRTQTEEQATLLDSHIQDLVTTNVPPHRILELPGDIEAPHTILSYIHNQKDTDHV